MKILLVSHSDQNGGAAKAAYRLLEALNLKEGVYAEMWVLEKSTNSVNVKLIDSKRHKVRLAINKIVERLARSFWCDQTSGYGSLGLTGIPLAKKINDSEFDVVNLHWVQGGMLAIDEISKIKKPVVWTLHDMWAFSGFFHYTERDWKASGIGKKILDIDYRIWRKKVEDWQDKCYKVVCPSSWIESKARQSVVYKKSSLRRIGYAIDSELWDKDSSNGIQALSSRRSKEDKVRILFGASGGLGDRRKGFDLLVKALEIINENTDDQINISLLVAGQERGEARIGGIETVYLGVVRTEDEMVGALSKADLAVIPSRSDNLPNMAIEAQACMLPVVGFDIGGMSDIVEHKVTGYLAKAEDHKELAKGIRFVCKMLKSSDKMSRDARSRAIQLFSYQRIGEETIDFFKDNSI